MYDADRSVRKRFGSLPKEEQQEVVRADRQHRIRVLEIIRIDGLRTGVRPVRPETRHSRYRSRRRAL